MAAFAPTVRSLVNGEAVEAGVTNRPTGDLAQRTQYLKETLDAALAGQTVTLRSVALDSLTAVGTPVYLGTDGIYRPGLVGLGSAFVGGSAAETSYARGIVTSKATSNLGDVTVSGLVTGTTSFWAALFDDSTFHAGPVYLSGVIAGRLSNSPGSIPVSLGGMGPDGSFLVAPQTPYIGQHSHQEFTLLGSPAGTISADPSVGTAHTITTPNTSTRGWLPANATYFPGWTLGVQIPSAAVFGYNLQHASETALRGVFPPIPVGAAIGLQNGVELNGLFLVNEYGIWWTSSAYGQAPWPTDYVATSYAAPVLFRFARYGIASSFPVVTTLAGHPASIIPVELHDSTSDAIATKGQLLIKIPSLLASTSSADEGGTAVKSITGAGFTTGPVVSRILPGAGALITGTLGDGISGRHGVVTIGLSASDALQGEFSVSALNSAGSATLLDLPITSLPAGLSVAPTWVARISESAPLSSTLTLLAFLTTDAVGTLPITMDWRYRIVTPTGSAVGVPSGWSSAVAFPAQSVGANTVVRLTLGTVPAVPRGSLVVISVRRTAGDSYGGQVGVQSLLYTLA